MVRLPKEQASEMHSAKSLENSVSRIEQLLAAARRVAAEMERLKTGDILIGNQPSFNCAMGDLARWGKACEDALTGRLIEGGFFPPSRRPRGAHPPRKTGKAKKSRKA